LDEESIEVQYFKLNEFPEGLTDEYSYLIPYIDQLSYLSTYQQIQIRR
jgi:hypothetical protein